MGFLIHWDFYSFLYLCNFHIYSLLQGEGKCCHSTLCCTGGSTKTEKHRVTSALPRSQWQMDYLLCAVFVTHNHPTSVQGGRAALPGILHQVCQRKQGMIQMLESTVGFWSRSKTWVVAPELSRKQACQGDPWARSKSWRAWNLGERASVPVSSDLVSHCANLWEHSTEI